MRNAHLGALGAAMETAVEDLTMRADQPALSQDSGPILTVDDEEPLRRNCSHVVLDLKMPVMGGLECLHCLGIRVAAPT